MIGKVGEILLFVNRQVCALAIDRLKYHELMHLREMNHSAKFWACVGEVCPFWQEAERWIKKNGGLLGL